MTETYIWDERADEFGRKIHFCHAKDVTIDIFPRPHYCDRGRWIVYVVEPDTVIPKFDEQDGFPRYFFSLPRAKAEMEDMLRFRKIAPAIDLGEDKQ